MSFPHHGLRTFVLHASLLLFGVLAATQAAAQKYPERPIRLVIPYAAGGGTDNLVRTIVSDASTALGQPIIVDNKPGAGSVIGTEAVAKAAPDGYTLLAADGAIFVNPGLLKARMPFDTLKSLQGVTMLARSPVMLVVHPSVPAQNQQELIAYAKSKPGALNFASGGSGSTSHLAGELLKRAANINIVHVAYKGTAPAMSDLLAGHVQMQFAGISSAREHVAAGKLRAIAVSGEQRNLAMPAVPTFAESGLNVDADTYFGVYAPIGTPSNVIETVNKALVQALRNPANVAKLAAMGYVPVPNTPTEHTRQLHTFVKNWAELIERANIRTD